MELGARARRLGDDRVGRRRQPVAPGDADGDVLAARVEDLLAQQLVARVGAERGQGHVALGEGRQDADHHLVRADLAGRGLRVVERAPQAVLEGGQPTLAQGRRGDVDLDVELAELGLEVRLGDRLQHLGVLERRVTPVVDEVELDLEPGHRVVGVEAGLAQHPGEDVEVAPHLLAVARAIGPRELLLLDFFSHGATLATREPPGQVSPPAGMGALRPRGSGRPAVPAPARTGSQRSGGQASSSRSATSRAREWAGSTARHRSTAHHASAPVPREPGGHGQHRGRAGHELVGQRGARRRSRARRARGPPARDRPHHASSRDAGSRSARARGTSTSAGHGRRALHVPATTWRAPGRPVSGGGEVASTARGRGDRRRDRVQGGPQLLARRRA